MNFPTLFDSKKLRKTLRGKCNRVLKATASFLESFVSEPKNEKPGGVSAICVPHLSTETGSSPVLLCGMEIPMNQFSMPARKKSTTPRSAEVFRRKTGYSEPETLKRVHYPEARDIRPPCLKNLRTTNRRELSSIGFKEKERRAKTISKSEGGRVLRYRTQPSSQAEDVDRCVPPRSVQQVQARQSRLFKRNQEAYLQDAMIRRVMLPPRHPGSANQPNISRKCKEQRKTDWVKYERDRRIYPPACQKREREVTTKSILEEPELKLRRIGEYWSL